MADDEQYGSREQLRRRGRGSADASRSTDGMYRPGQPIGFLAARGTPYEKKYLTKKLGWCCVWLAPPIAIVTAVIALVPIVWAIALHTLHVTQLHIEQANITSITNSSFPLALNAQVAKSGIFPATLYFRAPIDVYWRLPPSTPGGDAGPEVHLGQMELGRVSVAAGHGKVLQITNFEIKDVPAFGTFSEFLITQPEFTWYLHCPDVHAEAFGFLPAFKNYDFKKHVVFNGFDNFHNVKILDFQLPGDDPEGGISAQVLTSLTNPSAFAVQLGSLNLDLYYKDLYLGPARASDNVNVTSGVNTVLLLARLIPHNDNQTALDLLGELFTGYINGDAVPVVAHGVSTKLANGDTIGWLSQGIAKLRVNVPLQAPSPINPIKGINIDYLSLAFDNEQPWAPITYSNALKGTIGLPFGFSLNILSTANNIALSYDNKTVANINGAYSNSSTKLDLISAGQTAGQLDITLPPTRLQLPSQDDQAHQNFIDFQKALVYAPNAKVQLIGTSKALTDTPVGRVLLDGIKFDVGSGLRGLDSLTRYPTTVTSVDVTGGTKDAIQLQIGTGIINPSNLNLTTGDTTFHLYNEVKLGDVLLPNLNLKIGQNDVIATSNFSPNLDPKGYETLNRFISGLDTNLNITGFDGSSSIPSLNPTFIPIRLNTSLPGLNQTLVRSANLTVLDSTGITDNVANAFVQLANPFTAGLTITKIASKVYSHGVMLATIDTPLVFPAAGKAVTSSPNIPLALNLYPPDIFAALRAFAVDAKLDPAYIDGIVALGGFTLTKTTDSNVTVAKRDEESASNEGGALSDLLMGAGADYRQMQLVEEEETEASPAAPLAKRANLYTGFDLTAYVATAFKSARTDLEIISDAVIGEYGTTLTFTQTGVPLGTDQTLFKLLPVLAGPIVQKIVDGAILNIDRATVQDPGATMFNAALQGSLVQSGPFDAIVEFTKGLNVMYKGRLLGQINMPNITLVGDVGSTLDLTAPFKIADVDFMREFTTDALADPTFVWNIAAEGITAHALGIAIPNITLSKDVILTGFNGLKNDVIIQSFDLPSNDPAGGISLIANAMINNRAQVGVQLSRFGTMISGNGTELGPTAAANPFTLEALAQTPVTLKGRLQQQTSQQGLDTLSTVFTRFVHDQATTLSVAGQYAGPPEATWLNDAIKTLIIDVSLPSIKFQVIKAVSLNQLSLAFTEGTAWSPPTSTTNTTAPFFLPFGFPLDISEVAGAFIANYNGQDAAVLNVPAVNTKTDVSNRVISLAFENVPFAVYDNAHPTFSQFLADTTANEQVTFNLHGTTNAKANTAAGLVSISDIPFSVDSTILGLQNFNARPAEVSNLDVARGYPSYLMITLDTALYNPSDVTITVGDVKFNTLYTDRMIGEALINGLMVTPGTNVLPTVLNYSPQGSDNVRAGRTVLENYIQNITSEAKVAGSYGSTPIESLQQALAGVALNTNIPALGRLIVTKGFLHVPPTIAQSPLASVEVVVDNPFTASLNILKINSAPTYMGQSLGTINVDLGSNPIRTPGHTVATSQTLPITLDTNPKSLVKLVLALAKATGTSLGPWYPFFDEILNLPNNAATQVQAYPDSQDTGCHIGNEFDLLGAVLQALKGLAVRIPISAGVNIDEYYTDLDFVQDPVPIVTDRSALNLLGPAGAPLIQLIVDQAALSFAQANATHLTDNGFTVSLRGSLLTDAPANALIEFTQPLTVTWQGSQIAEISLPPICTNPGVGVPDLETTGQLRITNQKRFTDFAVFLLHNEEFQWQITSSTVVVRALGIVFSKVNLDKTITLKAFNNLPGVTISNFDIPSEGPDYLNFVTDTKIPSPATLGVELGTATFRVNYKTTYLGPAQANNLFLTPKSGPNAGPAITNTVLNGRLIDQSNNPQGLEDVGVLFSRFLAGKDTQLTVQGQDVISPYQDSPIKWLSAAFKTLFLDVTLPGKIYQIIFSITISDLTVILTGSPDLAYDVPTTNKNTLAKYSNPFHFTLAPVAAGPDLIIVYQGVETAELKIALKDAIVNAEPSTGPETQSNLNLAWNNQTLHSLNNGQFNNFFAALTDTPGATFGLRGSTDVRAKTHIGTLTITGIPVNVTTSLKGIDSFGGNIPLSDAMVTGSTPQYIIIPLTTTLNNPSNITIYTRDVYIPALYKNVEVGRAFIKSLALLPGSNTVPAQFRYQPDSPANQIAGEVVTRYLQPLDNGNGGPDAPTLQISGKAQVMDYPVSPYGSLIPALEGVRANSTLQGIGARLVQSLTATIDLLTAPFTNMITATLTIKDPLPAGITINALYSRITKGGDEGAGTRSTVGTPDNLYRLSTPLTVAGNGGEGTSVPIEATLTNGTFGSLDLIGSPLSTNNIIDTTIEGGYNLPRFVYNEWSIPTVYVLTIGPVGIPIPSLPVSIPGLIPEILGAFGDDIGAAIDFLTKLLGVCPPAQCPTGERVIQNVAGAVLSPVQKLCLNPLVKGLPICNGVTYSTSTTTTTTTTSTATTSAGTTTAAGTTTTSTQPPANSAGTEATTAAASAAEAAAKTASTATTTAAR